MNPAGEAARQLTEEQIAEICRGLSDEEADKVMNDPRVKPIVDKYLEKLKRRHEAAAK